VQSLFLTLKERNYMIFTSLKLRSVVAAAVLAVSATYAVASTIPSSPFPLPPGSQIANAIPSSPFPLPPGSQIADAIPSSPFPLPPGSQIANAIPSSPFPLPPGSQIGALSL
jgi:hypothetical protein